MTPFTSAKLMTEVEMAIRNYEPRISLKSVTVVPYYDKNAYDVTVIYFIENFTQEFTANFLLSRLR
jgi:phage baseplate assembly protein W